MENSNNVIVLADVVQTGRHHQGDIPYRATAGIQCSCMSFMSLFCRILKTIARWDTDDLDKILQNGDSLFKSLSIFRLLGVDHLPAELKICDQVVRIELLENKTGDNNPKYISYFINRNSSSFNTGNGALFFVTPLTNEAVLLNCFFLHLSFFVRTCEIRKWDAIPLHLLDFLDE